MMYCFTRYLCKQYVPRLLLTDPEKEELQTLIMLQNSSVYSKKQNAPLLPSPLLSGIIYIPTR